VALLVVCGFVGATKRRREEEERGEREKIGAAVLISPQKQKSLSPCNRPPNKAICIRNVPYRGAI